MDADGLTPLERERLARIKENKERLEALGLPQLTRGISAKEKAAQEAKRAAQEAREATLMPPPSADRRRSSRAASAAASARLRLSSDARGASGVRGPARTCMLFMVR
jgi:hypothetical protein